MKSIVIIYLFILISSVSIDAQQINKKINSKNKATKLLVDSSKKSLISLDTCINNSKDSCKFKKNKGQCRMKDTFIDKDGDGINDNRCNGMGLGCKKRNRNCGGKK
jgi:phosphorylcholine metabolism protein LicD